MTVLVVITSILFHSIGFALSEICGSPKVFVGPRFDKRCSWWENSIRHGSSYRRTRERKRRNSWSITIWIGPRHDRSSESLIFFEKSSWSHRGSWRSPSADTLFEWMLANFKEMEGTGMINDAAVRQESRKLWQYLASISGISTKTR